MKQTLQLAILFIFTSFIAGCETVSIDRENSSDLTPIEEGISFSVTETFGARAEYNASVKPHIQLQMQTKDIFPCMNYPIVSELNHTGQELNIKIHGVKEGGICLTALGPAMGAYKLDLSPGEYKLNFNYKGSYSALLTVTDSSLAVSAAETHFMTPQTETFWRYPENSFAFLCSSTSETRWMCRDFEQMLNDSLSVESFDFPDYGIIPYPDSEVDDHYDITSYYYYSDNAVYLKAGAMLNAYADSVVSTQEGAYISILNWKNKGFYSWTKIDNINE